MQRDSFLYWLLCFILIGVGFVLGIYYSANGGILRQGNSISLTAPSQLTQTGTNSPLFMARLLIDAPWKQEPDEEMLFPAHVGTLQMDKLIAGSDALAYAKRIHGNDAPLESVFIPTYSNRNERVTAWVLEMHSTHEAIKHLRKINNYISKQHPENYGSFYLQDVQVFHLQACSENSYYYRKDNTIYWVSLVTSDPIPLFLRFYEHF